MFIVADLVALNILSSVLSHIQKPVSNFHLCQLFTIKVYMATVQFAAVPNKSSISNNSFVYAIMVMSYNTAALSVLCIQQNFQTMDPF